MQLVSIFPLFAAFALIKEGTARCQGDFDICDPKDPNLNCCNGHACRLNRYNEYMCFRVDENDNTICGYEGADCSIYDWCCDGLVCKERYGGRYDRGSDNRYGKRNRWECLRDNDWF